MSETSVEGLPVELISADLARGAVDLQLDEAAYPLDALYGAAYIFIDRCYVLIDRPAAGRWRVSLSPKQAGADAAQLRALAGEFANELLSCAWRHKITQDNRRVIEQVTTEAIAGAMGSPSLDDLAKLDFTGQALEDPLGIAQSWEEKYKKKKAEK
ncbi:MAG TPA: His-Xaa-Ser system protein HxsD [Polyangia bacterium]|jgi:His-Xaa-Ser system protein HxsD|nr:His-Xaa-Ser system protein HxsD [Polyangia bacterium]